MSRYTNPAEYSPASYYMQPLRSDRSDRSDKSDTSEMSIKMACKILEIEDDVNKLKDTFAMLNTIVTNQQTTIETLENSVVNSKENVKVAEQDLKEAATYNFRGYLWYLGGLALGGLAYLGYDFTTKKTFLE